MRTATVYGDTNGHRITLRSAGSKYGNSDLQMRLSSREFALTSRSSNAVAELQSTGAYINRLEYASDNLLNVAQNTDASRSRIEDADYARETRELAKDSNHCTGGNCDARPGQSDQADGLALLQ